MTGAERIDLPVLIQKDEDGFYVVECPLLPGCYTQGKTLDEALKNLQEVIELCLEELPEEAIRHLKSIRDLSCHVVSVEI